LKIISFEPNNEFNKWFFKTLRQLMNCQENNIFHPNLLTMFLITTFLALIILDQKNSLEMYFAWFSSIQF
jgi:hypothetical protein